MPIELSGLVCYRTAEERQPSRKPLINIQSPLGFYPTISSSRRLRILSSSADAEQRCALLFMTLTKTRIQHRPTQGCYSRPARMPVCGWPAPERKVGGH